MFLHSSPCYETLLFSFICVTLCKDDDTKISSQIHHWIEERSGMSNREQSDSSNPHDRYCSSVAEKYVSTVHKDLKMLLVGFKKTLMSSEYVALRSNPFFSNHSKSHYIFSQNIDDWMIQMLNQFNEISDIVLATSDRKLMTVNKGGFYSTVKAKLFVRSSDTISLNMNETTYECGIQEQNSNGKISLQDNFQCWKKSGSVKSYMDNSEIQDIMFLNWILQDMDKPLTWKVQCNSETAVKARVVISFPMQHLMNEATFAPSKYAPR